MKKELEECESIILAKEVELILLRKSVQGHGERMNTKSSVRASLLSDASQMKILLESCAKKVKSMTARVSYPESMSMKRFIVRLSTAKKNKRKTIKRFTSNLFPSLNHTQQLTSIFDELYNTFESFRKHVKSQ